MRKALKTVLCVALVLALAVVIALRVLPPMNAPAQSAVATPTPAPGPGRGRAILEALSYRDDTVPETAAAKAACGAPNLSK